MKSLNVNEYWICEFCTIRQPYRGIMNLSLAGDTHITSSDLSTHMAAVALGDLTELFPIN